MLTTVGLKSEDAFPNKDQEIIFGKKHTDQIQESCIKVHYKTNNK